MEHSPKVRIWVAWRKKTYQIKVLMTTEQLVHRQVCQVNNQKLLYITFIYGLNSISRRKSLWLDLRSIAANMREAWGVIGDFNAVLCLKRVYGERELSRQK